MNMTIMNQQELKGLIKGAIFFVVEACTAPPSNKVKSDKNT